MSQMQKQTRKKQPTAPQREFVSGSGPYPDVTLFQDLPPKQSMEKPERRETTKGRGTTTSGKNKRISRIQFFSKGKSTASIFVS